MSVFRAGTLTASQAAELNKLRSDVNRLLSMKGVGTTKVDWSAGVPVVVPDDSQMMPVLVSGYTSGVGISGQGVYWFNEQAFDYTGGRAVKQPGLFGGVTLSGQISSGYGYSGIISGVPVNPLYETNNQVIPTGMFPYQGWARRRSVVSVESGPGFTMGQAYEFDFNLSGTAGTGGGISGINLKGQAAGLPLSGTILRSGIVDVELESIAIYSGPSAGGYTKLVPNAAAYSIPGIITASGTTEQVLGFGPKAFQADCFFGASGNGGGGWARFRETGGSASFDVDGTWDAYAAINQAWGGQGDGRHFYLAPNINSGAISSGTPTVPTNDPSFMFGTNLEHIDSDVSGEWPVNVMYVPSPNGASIVRPAIILSGFEPFIDLRGTNAAYYCQTNKGGTGTVHLLSGITEITVVGGLVTNWT